MVSTANAIQNINAKMLKYIIHLFTFLEYTILANCSISTFIY